MVAPNTTGSRVNFEVPELPEVEVGSPWQNSIGFAMPPQTVGYQHRKGERIRKKRTRENRDVGVVRHQFATID